MAVGFQSVSFICSFSSIHEEIEFQSYMYEAEVRGLLLNGLFNVVQVNKVVIGSLKQCFV